jgi:hypothetical protein
MKISMESSLLLLCYEILNLRHEGENEVKLTHYVWITLVSQMDFHVIYENRNEMKIPMKNAFPS